MSYESYCALEASEQLIIEKYQEYLLRFSKETKEFTFQIITQYSKIYALEMMARVNALIKDRVLQGKFE